MRAEKIKVDGYEFENITECSGRKAFGEHGDMVIKGVIKKGKEMEYLSQSQIRDKVHVTVTDWEGTEKNLLHGILHSVRFLYENGVPVMTLHITTASYLTDQERHIRSFQQEGTDCSAAARICLREYLGGGHILGNFEQKQEPGLLLQYEETDWEFLGRLASRSHALLLADDETGDAKIYFGVPRFQEVREIKSDSYVMHKDMTVSQKTMSEIRLKEDDLITYEVEEREIFKVGEKVRFLNKTLCIMAMDFCLKGSELVHIYYLRTERGIATGRRQNQRLPGNSLASRVSGVERDKVTVEITADENKSEAGRRWFPYATVYSTPDGTGWYCMPEIGDEVRIFFPTLEEEEAYIENSVHLEEGSGTRGNPHEKSIMNKQRKEILFTPDSLILRNNNGMSIELLDNEGIKIISDKSVLIKANDTIQMNSSSGEIDINAGQSISMQQGSSQLRMADKITMTGGKINLN